MRILRVPATAFGRRSKLARVADYGSFLAGATARLFGGRPDVVIALSTPPFVAALGVLAKRLAATRVVFWVMDVYPEVAVQLGALDGRGLVARLLSGLARLLLSRADAVVALDDAMRARLIAQGAAPERVTVIDNWVDGEDIRPLPLDGHPLRASLGLGDRFTVSYSGNMGLGHDFDTIVGAMGRLRDEAVHWLFIGEGPQRDALERAAHQAGVALHVLALSAAARAAGEPDRGAPVAGHAARQSGRPAGALQALRLSGRRRTGYVRGPHRRTGGRGRRPGRGRLAAQRRRRRAGEGHRAAARRSRCAHADGHSGRGGSTKIASLAPPRSSTTAGWWSGWRHLNSELLSLTPAVGLAAGFVLALLLTPVVKRWAVRAGAVDLRSHRKIQAQDVPRLGGVAIAAGFFVPVLLIAFRVNLFSGALWEHPRQIIGLLIGAWPRWLLGVYDDLRGASALKKLSVQIPVGVLTWWAGIRIGEASVSTARSSSRRRCRWR